VIKADGVNAKAHLARGGLAGLDIFDAQDVGVAEFVDAD